MAELRLLLLACWPFPLEPSGRRWLLRALRTDDPHLKGGCLERSAQAGDLDALVLLADYHAGRGQRDRALPLFQRAAEAGHPAGAFAYAEMLRWEYPGGSRGLKESFRWYHRAAEAGFGPAQAWLAWAYQTGEGVAADEGRAATWAARTPTFPWPPSVPPRAEGWHPFRALWNGWETLNLWVGQYAIRPWYPFALAVLLVLTFHGVFWWLGMPSCGLVLAFLILGAFSLSVVRGPYRRRISIRKIERAAQEGDSDARHLLGLAYRDGSFDVPRDRHLARKHFQIAAEAGHRQAMVDLADLLRWGLGGDIPDPEGAQAWLERARAAGHPDLVEDAIAGSLPVTSAAPPAPGPNQARLQEAQRQWEDEVGPKVSRWLLAGAAMVLLGILIHQTYRNTSWLGRRDRKRIVWGDAANRVAAPRDPMATLPIPADRRLSVEGLSFKVIEGGKPWHSTDDFRGRPALFVLSQGRYPAFREALEELDGLTVSHGDRAAIFFCHLPQGELGGGVNVIQWFGELKVYHLVMAVAEGPVDQPALGDLTHTPVTFVLDRQGRVRQRWQGYQPGLMREALEAALAEGQ